MIYDLRSMDLVQRVAHIQEIQLDDKITVQVGNILKLNDNMCYEVKDISLPEQHSDVIVLLVENVPANQFSWVFS